MLIISLCSLQAWWMPIKSMSSEISLTSIYFVRNKGVLVVFSCRWKIKYVFNCHQFCVLANVTVNSFLGIVFSYFCHFFITCMHNYLQLTEKWEKTKTLMAVTTEIIHALKWTRKNFNKLTQLWCAFKCTPYQIWFGYQ